MKSVGLLERYQSLPVDKVYQMDMQDLRHHFDIYNEAKAKKELFEE